MKVTKKGKDAFDVENPHFPVLLQNYEGKVALFFKRTGSGLFEGLGLEQGSIGMYFLISPYVITEHWHSFTGSITLTND